MKRLYMIGGTMGVGKTTVCQIMKKELPAAVFLDGDWCWDMHPFQVTDETKAMVVDNICYMLNNFLKCSKYENVIFCWVMHEQSIIDSIFSRLDTDNCKTTKISLICSEKALRAHLQNDIEAGRREADVIERSAKRLPLYTCLETIKIDVSDMNANQAAMAILNIQ